MKRYWHCFLLVFIFIGLIFIIANEQKYLFRLSPQGKINPQTIKEEFNPTCTTAVCDNITIPIPSMEPKTDIQLTAATGGEKRIEVDLTNQRVYAYEGDKQVFNFLVSTGKWGRTPTGIFTIWIKLLYTRMTGGSKVLHTYYDLPNVPYVMFFSNDVTPKEAGYSLHGTYWHHNFGHPMSHGCVNLSIPDAEKLYYWTLPDLKGKTSIKATADNPGTKVIIYGNPPAQ